MAITWNATTKKWTLVGTCSAAGAALLVWAGVAIGNANSNANEAKGVAGAAMGQVKSVEGAVEALDAEVDLVYEAVEQAQRTADNALKEVKVHRDSTIAQGVHQAAKKPAAKPVAKKEEAKPAAKPVAKKEESKPAAKPAAQPVKMVAAVCAESGKTVVQQSASEAPVDVNVDLGGKNTGATVVATDVSVVQGEKLSQGAKVVQQMATEAPSNVQVTVSGDNKGVVAVGTNVHVEQTVLPDDYVEVTVKESCTVVLTDKAYRQMRRRCR